MKRAMNVVVTTKTTMKLDSEEIVKLLRAAGHEVPDNVSVTFTVPTGGDYAGMTISLSQNEPVEVSWITIKEEAIDDGRH